MYRSILRYKCLCMILAISVRPMNKNVIMVYKQLNKIDSACVHNVKSTDSEDAALN